MAQVTFKDTRTTPTSPFAGLSARMRPGLLTRYILREIAVPSILALAVVGFIFVGVEIREAARVLPFEFVTWRDMALLTACFLPTLAYYVIPTSYMMGTLLAFSRLSSDSEITAAKAAGIPVKRIVVPVILVGGLLSVVSFFLQDWAQPMALRRANVLIYRELPLRATLDVLPTGVMHAIGDWCVYIGDRDPATRSLKDIDILMPKDDGEDWVYHAESAEYEKDEGSGRIVMKNAHLIMPEVGGHILSPSLTLPLPPIPQEEIPNERKMKSLKGLLEHASTETSDRELMRTHTEISERISLPLACFAVSFVAAPLAARARRSGRSYSFAIGFSVLLVYFLLLKVLEPRSLLPLWQVFVRSAAPNLVLCLAGCWALWRVDRV